MTLQVPTVSTAVGESRAINKLKWDFKEGRRAAMGGSDGKIYVYDIGDMAIPRESEWTDMQKAVAEMVDRGSGLGVLLGASDPLAPVPGR